MLLDIIGWIGLAACVAAFGIKNVFYLRILTTFGCIMLAYVYWVKQIPQGYVGNIIIIIMNVYYLHRMYKNRELHNLARTFKRKFVVKLRRKTISS